MARASVNVKDFASRDSTTAGIQEAVDSLPKSGGSVYLPAGRYRLRRSVELRSRVRLHGEGPATVVLRPKEVVTLLAKNAHGESRTLHLKNSRGLRPGDEIHVGDDECEGWWASHCEIKQVIGKRLSLEVLWGERRRRFLTGRRAFAANWFPAFWLRDIQDVTVEDLTIDGGIRKHRRAKCDFVVAAVHSRECRNVRVLNVTVRNWPGDGIGLQAGRGGLVSGCVAENCAGYGFHPGTGVTESIWSDNCARGCTRDGFFFCLRVTHSTVRGSVFTGNGGHGIGGLSDPDCCNVVAGNVCADNGMHGIDADRAIGNTIQGNVCRNNSRSAPGKYAGILLSKHRDNVVTGNVCIDDAPEHTQLRGLVEKRPAGSNIVKDNQVALRAPLEG